MEGHNFDIRKHLIDYDDVMNKQRKAIYGLRREVLQGDKIDEIVRELLGDQVSSLLDSHADESANRAAWNLEALQVAMQQQFGLEVDFGDKGKLKIEEIVEKVKSSILAGLEFQKTHLGPFYGQVAKMILLQTIDQRWKEHLQRMDQMREWIGLRGYAQKDPLVEYKQEAFKMFEEMNGFIRGETLEKLFKIQLVLNPESAGTSPEFGSQELGGGRADGGRATRENRNDGPSASEQLEAMKPKKTRLTFGPPDEDSGPSTSGMSRAARRAMERVKKRR